MEGLAEILSHVGGGLLELFDPTAHLLLGWPERHRLLGRFAPPIPRDLHHGVQWDLLCWAILSRCAHQEATHHAQCGLVGDDQDRLLGREQLEHHRVETSDDVIVRLAWVEGEG